MYTILIPAYQPDDKLLTLIKEIKEAIGIISDHHYLIVVSDGRTSESQGLTLYQLTQFLQSYGAKTAYHLDSGGASIFYFNGQIMNKPTTRGTISERTVRDIVYIGG